MVRKLIKYDFQSYLRLLLPIQLILIAIAALNRIVQFFEDTHSTIYNTIFTSSLVLYIISIIVCIVLTVIVAIVRFYQGMYTGEGYLNHTLPVTPSQHIFAKLLTSFLFDFGSLLAIFLSFMVITAGDLNIEIFKAAFYILGKTFIEFGTDLILYIVEAFVLFIIFQFTVYLRLYFCISVGQLVSRKKVLLAFGVFFGLYVISQVIGTILIIVFTVNTELMEQIGEWITDNERTFAHIVLCGEIVWQAILGGVFFLISKHIMGKRLNLT